jgi:transcription elongation factor Elf1
MDRLFINKISNRLDKFVWQSPSKANFRCPICGDSQTDKSKKRAYLLQKNQTFIFYCHNCTVSMSFANFLKTFDPNIFREYLFEKYKTKEHKIQTKQQEKKQQKIEQNLDSYFVKISTLCSEHLAYQYLIDRKIDSRHFDSIYYSQGQFQKIEKLFPAYTKLFNEQRLIFPCYSREKQLLGCQTRQIVKTKFRLRYMMFKNPEVDLVYGLEKVDITKDIYVCEGIFDSLMIENSVAMLNLNFLRILNYFPKEKLIFIFDNQPRNQEVCKVMEKVISEKLRILIWDSVQEKDVNEFICKNNSNLFKKMVDKRVCSNLKAQLDFMNWRKI